MLFCSESASTALALLPVGRGLCWRTGTGRSSSATKKISTGLVNVLQLETPEGADEHAWLILDVVVDPFGDEHLTGRTETLDARGDVDTVSVDALSLTHDVTGVDADPEWESRLGRQIPLNLEGAGHGLDGAAEDGQAAVAVMLEQITPAPRHGLLQDPAMPITVGARGFLVPLHEGRVARHVGEHDGG